MFLTNNQYQNSGGSWGRGHRKAGKGAQSRYIDNLWKYFNLYKTYGHVLYILTASIDYASLDWLLYIALHGSILQCLKVRSLESQYLDTNAVSTIFKLCNVRQITCLSLCYYILKIGVNIVSYLLGLLWELNEIIYVKFSEHSPTQSKHSRNINAI